MLLKDGVVAGRISHESLFYLVAKKGLEGTVVSGSRWLTMLTGHQQRRQREKTRTLYTCYLERRTSEAHTIYISSRQLKRKWKIEIKNGAAKLVGI